MSFPRSNHLGFIRRIVDIPIEQLESDYQSTSSTQNSSSAFAEDLESRITHIHKEKMLLHGSHVITNRVFVETNDSWKYASVGWIIPLDIDFCMVCGHGFGFFTYKHTCHACGNVVCNACSSNKQKIAELPSFGPMRVCDLCYWGQDEVSAVCYDLSFNDRSISVSHQSTERKESINLEGGDAPQSKENVNSLNSSRKLTSLKMDSEKYEQFREDEFASTANADGDRASSYEDSALVSHKLFVKNVKASIDSFTMNNSPSSQSMEANSVSSINNISKASVQKESEGKLARNPSLPLLMIIRPTAGFVVKTRRETDRSKVFINITTHTSIPYKNDGTPNRVICMVCGDKRPTLDKSGDFSTVYDIVVHPDEVQICLLDPTERARTRLCEQALKLIREEAGDLVELTITLFKISTYYKYSNLSRSEIDTIAVPQSLDAYYTKRQYKTSIPSRAVDAIQKQEERVSLAETPTKPAPPVNGRRWSLISAFHPKDVNQTAAAPVLPDLNLAVYLVPLERVIPGQPLKSIGDFEKIDQEQIIITPRYAYTISLVEVDSRPVFINVCHHPKVGVVCPRDASPTSDSRRRSLTYRWNSGTFPSYADISGASVLQESAPVPSTHSSILADVPKFLTLQIPKVLEVLRYAHIFGSVNENNFNGSKTEYIYDIVVPTAVLQYVVNDATPTAQRQVTERIVDIIRRSFHRKLESSKLPLQFLYRDPSPAMMSSSSRTIDSTSSAMDHSDVALPPVWNLMERFRTQYTIAVDGVMYKQDHIFRKWSKKYINIVGSALTNSVSYCGTISESVDISVLSCTQGDSAVVRDSEEKVETRPHSASISSVSAEAAIKYILRLSSLSPSAVTVTTNENNRPSYQSRFASEEDLKQKDRAVLYEQAVAFDTIYDRDLFQSIIRCQNIHLDTTLHLTNLLPRKTGWLSKQGHLVLSWHTRYCTLHQGVLCYFDKGPNGESYVPTYHYKHSHASETNSTAVRDKGKGGSGFHWFRKNSRSSGARSPNPHDGTKFKGFIVLHGASVSNPSAEESSRFRISSVFNGCKDFLFEAENKEEALEWIMDLKKHIHFADKFPYLVDLKHSRS